MKINHLDARDLAGLRSINARLFAPESLNGDERRDLANTMHVLLDKIESFDIDQPTKKAVHR